MTGGSGVPVEQGPAYAAALCAGLAVWLLSGRNRELHRARLLFAGGGHAPVGPEQPPSLGRKAVGVLRRWWVARWGEPPGPELWCLPAGAVVSFLGESVLPLLLVAPAMLLARWSLRRRERRRVRKRTAAQVAGLCGAIAGELRAGLQPNEALRTAVAATPGVLGAVAAPVMAAARFGGDVPEALRQAAQQPGAEGLLGVAACWQVASDGGAGLATGLERVSLALRAEREQEEELRAQLAGTRSTAVMLALLPLFGMLMGTALGAEPLRVLLHTPAGWACLAMGALFEAAGLAWTGRIVRSAIGGQVRERP